MVPLVSMPTTTIEFGLRRVSTIFPGLRKINSLGIVNGRRKIFNGFLIALVNNIAILKEKDERIRCNSFDSWVANCVRV